MIINIEEIENLYEKQKEIPFNEIIEDLNNGKPVSGLITVKSFGSKIIINGHVETDLTIECDRCLKSYLFHVNAEIDEVFIKGHLDTENKKEFELNKETLVEELNDKTEINLTNLAYQEIILNIPSKKICSEECEGNYTTSKQDIEDSVDPRLKALRSYFDNNK